MTTAFGRGWLAGWRNNNDGVAAAMQTGPVARAFAVEDYAACAEEELLEERRLVVEALEAVRYLRRARDEDEAEAQALARVPEHLREGLTAYLDEHRPTGSFLRAVLVGDLHDAMARADLDSRTGLFELCAYLHNFAPSMAYGSRAAVNCWLTPVLPRLRVRLGGPVEEPLRCPRCGIAHPVHSREVNRGEVLVVVEDEPMAQPHDVQFLWCARVHLEVVAIDGRDFEEIA